MTLTNESSVSLIGHFGDDYTIIDAARTSTGKERKGIVADKKLLSYLWKNQHLSPFEQVNFQWHIVTPIFVARQIMRHRTFRFNEASARYKQMPMDFFSPEVWRKQNTEGNKQGSSGEIDNQIFCQSTMELAYNCAELAYNELLLAGVSKEQARMVLPVGLMTEMVVSTDLRNLLHFVQLRTDPHAQPEIQEVANKMFDLVSEIVPWTCDLFLEDVESGLK